MAKIVSLDKALDQLEDKMEIMIGGFMSCGTPIKIVKGIVERGIKDLTIIANDTGRPNEGIGRLIHNKRAKKLIASHIGLNSETGDQMNDGTLDVELVPQGTLAERIRTAGAGLGGFLTPTGVGTVVEEGKEKLEIDGEKYLLELPLQADVALVKAWKADKKGNLIYRKSARNFNPLIAMAADTVIVEAEEVLEIGEIDPNDVMTPAAFVDFIVGGEK
ncbi:acetate CoA-transferase subunit alpha [Sporohalobacter salinus]|uniref:acetate CoA-transferase subunit alpha n=1 Tax=Sporohalobacter salinus TaxID=1494606 RepID=UPI00195FEA64|nr:acetate CoA-transferase subunit alpha [Sporohalobacter salinus]MBM7622635.1 acetate CoA/acetoacetate CoA-transferase alpha subunit [Sporohalobacter salinus]